MMATSVYLAEHLHPVAYTIGTEFQSGPRKPSAERVHGDHW
jgi:hypothetical protein